MLKRVKANIDADPRLTVSQACEEAGLSHATLYRWLNQKPESVDLTDVVDLADYLHAASGHEDFTTLWIRSGE